MSLNVKSLKNISVDNLLKSLNKDILDELVFRHAPENVPWLITVQGIFGMLSRINYSEYWNALLDFIDNFGQFVHEVPSWSDIPEGRLLFGFESQDGSKTFYIDISENRDPDINAKMFLLFNKHVPLFIKVNGKTGVEHVDDYL